MPRINLKELDLDFDDRPAFEPVRRSTRPVSSGHDFQRRTENARNRFRKLAKFKEKNR